MIKHQCTCRDHVDWNSGRKLSYKTGQFLGQTAHCQSGNWLLVSAVAIVRIPHTNISSGLPQACDKGIQRDIYTKLQWKRASRVVLSYSYK